MNVKKKQLNLSQSYMSKRATFLTRSQEWQAKIKKSDCFWQETEYGFPIYGEVLENAYTEKHLKTIVSANATRKRALKGNSGHSHKRNL